MFRSSSGKFDLIITDIIMPDKEGIETIMELKKENPAIKIVAMSGGGKNKPEGYLHLAKQLGAMQTL
jgi:DNA-binding NarL/FixJ family response regulator